MSGKMRVSPAQAGRHCRSGSGKLDEPTSPAEHLKRIALSQIADHRLPPNVPGLSSASRAKRDSRLSTGSQDSVWRGN